MSQNVAKKKKLTIFQSDFCFIIADLQLYFESDDNRISCYYSFKVS